MSKQPGRDKGEERRGMWHGANMLLALSLFCGVAVAAEISSPDLPSPAQVQVALSQHLLVLNAASNLRLERANKRRWDSGNYEFNLRAGSTKRKVVLEDDKEFKEWDVALERPVRLLNKVFIDQDIGVASVARADYALGDARHEAGRILLRLWFGWQREQAQAYLWQQQVDILNQQAAIVDKRVKAGDAPRMEFNQAQAAASQASVNLQQAQLRAELAGSELARQFPVIKLPEDTPHAIPQPIAHDYAYWKTRILDDNHELGMVQAHSQVQHLLARRGRADQIPDPTIGLRHSSELSGRETLSGMYLSVPISFGQRSASADAAAQQAAIAADQLAFVERRLEGDIYAAHTQAVRSYATWQQANEAATAIRGNAELLGRAYNLGESSLADMLSARRLAQESTLAENLARLDANEARYRLLLDAHQLWPLDEAHEEQAHAHP